VRLQFLSFRFSEIWLQGSLFFFFPLHELTRLNPRRSHACLKPSFFSFITLREAFVRCCAQLSCLSYVWGLFSSLPVIFTAVVVPINPVHSSIVNCSQGLVPHRSTTLFGFAAMVGAFFVRWQIVPLLLSAPFSLGARPPLHLGEAGGSLIEDGRQVGHDSSCFSLLNKPFPLDCSFGPVSVPPSGPLPWCALCTIDPPLYVCIPVPFNFVRRFFGLSPQAPRPDTFFL